MRIYITRTYGESQTIKFAKKNNFYMYKLLPLDSIIRAFLNLTDFYQNTNSSFAKITDKGEKDNKLYISVSRASVSKINLFYQLLKYC